MRCATCGTENTADSRFCGGCGARMPSAQSLVAPTQKISDDARYPTPVPSAPTPHYTPSSIPPQNSVPASIPPQNHYSGPASITPHNSYQGAPNSVAPQAYAPTIQPQNQGPASVAPQNNLVALVTPVPGSIPPVNHPAAGSAPPRSPRPTGPTNSLVDRRSSPSVDASTVAPRGRRWGLIVMILLVDIALAGAGAYLLSEGLA